MKIINVKSGKYEEMCLAEHKSDNLNIYMSWI